MRGNRIADRLSNVAAPLAALIYPWLVALGPRVSPPLLLISLAVPALAFQLAYTRIDPSRYPSARRVAFLAVGSPALFSLIGGWLDGYALPITGLGFWNGLWTVLALWCVCETGQTTTRAAPLPSDRMLHLRTLHGVSAACIVTFATFHLANHLAGLASGDVHQSVMQALRLGYRNIVIEPVLIGCIVFQLVSGALMVWRAAAVRAGLVSTLQVASGTYLLCFFASHLSAVFRTRYLRGVNTDWHWLTGSPLLTDSWNARLVPYYWLGVVALGVHGAAGLTFILRSRGASASDAMRVFRRISIAAAVVAILILLGMLRSSDPALWRHATLSGE